MAAADVEETWQYNKTVLERNKHMLENQLATDVTFLVGENPARRIPAHQYVLISGSPVFYSMFCGDMKERGEVRVPDISPDTFTQMLRYLYYEEADVTGESVMQILYCAKKYLIPGLTKNCTDFLEINLSGENAATILEQCLVFDEKATASKCMKVIGEQTLEVIKSEGFGKISNDTLLQILESDSSSVSEVELFKASVDWARGKMPGKMLSGDMIRDTLGKALFKLRFPIMTANEFANIVVPIDVLSKDEEILCFRYCCQDKKPQNLPFPTKPRIDNSCEYIHLKLNTTNQDLSGPQVKYPKFTINNNTSRDLSIIGFAADKDISSLCYQQANDSNWRSTTFKTHSAGTCLHCHNKDQTSITCQNFTIPAASSYGIELGFSSGAACCIRTNFAQTFSDPTGTICVAVTGDIPISEILIAKSKA